jgi:mRNA interferase HigB
VNHTVWIARQIRHRQAEKFRAEKFIPQPEKPSLVYSSQIEIGLRAVRVISQRALREFERAHADAAAPLRAWLKLVRHGRFRNLAELKRTFANVDMVPVRGRTFYVFNIGGNKYRLVGAMHFNTQRLFVRHILTHADYDSERWKQ